MCVTAVLRTQLEIIEMAHVICSDRFLDVCCDAVLVQGDTNTMMAGALAASKLHIKVGHVEAGLRSFDRDMPEEINRVVADHISDYCFAPTETARGYLLKEGIDEAKICVTGNTIVNSVYQSREIAERKVDALKDLGLKSREYFLVRLTGLKTSMTGFGSRRSSWAWG